MYVIERLVLVVLIFKWMKAIIHMFKWLKRYIGEKQKLSILNMEEYLRIHEYEQTLREGHHDSSFTMKYCFVVLVRYYSCGVLKKKKINKK